MVIITTTVSNNKATMAFKFVVFAALLAAANAGLIGAPVAYSAGYASPYAATPYAHGLATPAITSQSSNILRSYGNLGQVSTYSKTIDTPYSSVRKSDVRVSNPGLTTYAAAPALSYAAPAVSYAAPVAHAAYAAPIAHAAYAAPVAHAAYAAPAVAHGVGVAYSAAPVVSHVSYSGLGVNYGW